MNFLAIGVKSQIVKQQTKTFGKLGSVNNVEQPE